MSEKDPKQAAATRANALITTLAQEHRELVGKAFEVGAELHHSRAKTQEANAKLAQARAQLARAGLLIDRQFINW